MAARAKGLIVVAALAIMATGGLKVLTTGGLKASGYQIGTGAHRIISLVPALTEMLFAIGAGPQVVAVSSYDDFPADTRTLPRVGALLDPDVERILVLRPDLVVTYGSQDALEAQLASAGIRTFSYRHGGIEALFQTMRDLGAAAGRAAEAERTAGAIRARLEAIRASVRGRPRPKVLLVFGREPRSLQQMYVSGGAGFLHDMLDIAGGTNVFADVPREAVQPSHETLLTRAPDVIVELHTTRPIAGAEIARERAVWSALGSMPAVQNGRIHFLNGDYLVVPGPRVGAATGALARAIHPEAFQ